MHGLDLLRDLVVILGVSVLAVLVLHRLRLPTITGFLVSGVLLGPHGFALISDHERIEVLADAGVVLLLFTIGVEFSLPGLRRLWKTAVAAGAVPVAVTVALGAATGGIFSDVIAARGMGLTTGQGIFLGFIISLSSTVIGLKALADRGQVDSPHGRAAVGVSVMQDLLVIPMMLLTPHLAPGRIGVAGASPILEPLLALLQAGAVIAGVLVVSMWLVPRLLPRLAALKSREVFVISVFCICLGTAWITSSLGLSLALGAFLGGLAVSESEYSHQALADVAPFRDSLVSLFFISIGMLIDPGVVLRSPVLVLGSAGLIIVFKLALIGGALLLAGQRPTVALQAGLALAQIGEFAFVLMRFGSGYDLLPEPLEQVLLASSVVTMVVTPLMMAASGPLIGWVRQWEERGWWRPPADLRDPDAPAGQISDHVIIVGYGFNGRNLARVLAEIGIPFVVLEMNSETVRLVRKNEQTPIIYGDATSPGILARLGADKARVLVLAISDPVSTRRAVAVARATFPGLLIVVRTRYLTEVDELYRLGAACVIPEEVETSMEIFSRVLEQFGVPREVLVKHSRRIRAERYGVFIEGRPEAGTAAPQLSGIKPLVAAAEAQVCPITLDSPAAGRSLADLGIHQRTGATVVALMRDGETIVAPDPGLVLAAGDRVVLAGAPDQVGSAIDELAARTL